MVPAGCRLWFFLSHRVFGLGLRLVPLPVGHSRCLCHGYMFMTVWEVWSVSLSLRCELTQSLFLIKFVFGSVPPINMIKWTGKSHLKRTVLLLWGLMLATVCCSRIAFNSLVSFPCMFVLCTCVFASSFDNRSCSFASLVRPRFTNCQPAKLGTLMHC